MKIIMGDWLMNAGIIGYMRIQESAGKKISVYDQRYIEIKKSDLKNFSHRYFTYALEQYMKNQFKVYTIINQNKTLDKKTIYELNSKIKDEADKINQKIKLDYNNFEQSVEKYVNTLSTLKDKVLEIIKENQKYLQIKEEDAKKLEEKIKDKFSAKIQRDENGKKKFLGKIAEIKDKDTKFLVTFFKQFYFNKGVIGQYGVERRKSFEEKYVCPAAHQLDSNDSKSDGIVCKFCRQNVVTINKFDDVNSIFSEGMFSTVATSLRFKNFFYNMQPDLFICDVCELLFLCAWAGLNEIPYQARNKINGEETDSNYLFVNIPSLELTYDENKKIDKQYKQSFERLEGTIYENIINDIFLQQHKTKSAWIIQNILFVELKTVLQKNTGRPNYHYFHIGKDVAKLFQDKLTIESFRRIQGNEKLSDRSDLNIGREVVSRILGHVSLLPLCYNLLHTYLNDREMQKLLNKVFNISLIFSIHNVIISGDRTMLKSNQVFGILNNLREEGSKFGNMEYEKRKSRSYILLSMIRNKKIDAFYDVIVKMYMSENKSIPESLVSILNHKDEIDFQSRAYAFMSGFLQKNSTLQQEPETL